VPITCGFDHVATLTTDLDRFADWYGQVFGAEVTSRMDAEGDHPRMFILDLGNGGALNVFEVPAETIIGEQRRLGGRGAIDHFGLAVDSLTTLEQVRERLVAAGAETGEIQQLGGEWSLFFRDVDGMELEVCAPTDT
jgi:catechol 2,3-dioxygenase-like lactoylglutathione lyase family enzyme